jgi:acetylornithine deacetylase
MFAANVELQPVELLARLVSFRTVSSDSNLDLIDYCRALLEPHGIACRVFPELGGRKASLAATLGPQVEGGVVLSGHTDVVPVEGQDWSSDPWTLARREGRCYGRGTTDMKSFLALALAAMVGAAQLRLKRPLTLAFSYDEEVGCEGGKLLAKSMAARYARPALVVVGEPTSMRVVEGHKAYLSLRTQITGVAVHSSRADLGVSAAAAAARLISLCDARMRRNAAAAAHPGFTPPYTTLNCGLVGGGTAVSTVAETAWFTTDVRCVPGEDPAAYLAWFSRHARRLEVSMRQSDPRCRVEVELLTRIPGLAPERAASALAAGWCESDEVATVSYGTEAGLFQEQGWPSVVCGPGDILQAHRADEFIAESQLAAGEAFLDKAVHWLTRDRDT